jgi:hypothetical protein
VANQPDPFTSLSEQDKKVAVDLSVALTVVTCHCFDALTKDLEERIIDSIAARGSLSRNTVKYAMRQLGQTLLRQNWIFSVDKEEANIRTQFRLTDFGGPNGGK